MKNNIQYCIVLLATMSLVQVAGAAPADIQPPKKREQIVEQANQLAKTTAPEAALPPENLRNPFSAVAVEEARAARPTSDKDLLQILAEQLQPTGVIGREEDLKLLLKGQKGVKVNEKLTLSFDGASYDVEVIAISNTNFSLRYNQTEITRPIKTGK
jgi:hypothetical protein